MEGEGQGVELEVLDIELGEQARKPRRQARKLGEQARELGEQARELGKQARERYG